MSSDEKYMHRCLELAKLGFGKAAPNPIVGSVIVFDGRIIGEGYHEKYGEPHAEVMAINSVKDKHLLPSSTIYVNLEPCAHFGKTPPCADLIVRHNFKRAVIATQDPFSEVNGAGIRKLVNAGIDVTTGVLEKEALELNRRFVTYHGKKRPYVILKWAETGDGFVDSLRRDASKDSLKITCDAANTMVHKWRSEEAAIMIGKNTALLDNPTLTTRKYRGKNPIRVLLAPNKSVPSDANIFNLDAETIVLSTNCMDLRGILTELHKLDIQSVLVEGGPTVHGSFINADLWDEIRRFVAPKLIKTGVTSATVNAVPEKKIPVGNDTLLIYRNR